MKEIVDIAKPDGTIFDDIDFELIEKITIPEDTETIIITDDIIKDDTNIPSDDGIAIDAPQKSKNNDWSE